jgi:uncharacterized protein (DUF486 family)
LAPPQLFAAKAPKARACQRSRQKPRFLTAVNYLGSAATFCGQLTRGLLSTALLLICSNVFMTFAWYGHLKYGHEWPLWKAILVSWGIALLEYCLAVPANRLGYVHFSGFQLKILQEVITLGVFIVFAVLFLQERVNWNYLVAFCLLIAAAVFAFAFKPAT